MAFSPQAESIFSKVFGRAPETSQERGFLSSAAERKQGGALQGALEFKQQQGGFGGQAASGQSQASDPISATIESLQKSVRGVQKAQENLSTEKQRNDITKQLLGNKGIQNLIKMEGSLGEQVQDFDSSIEGNKFDRPTTQGGLKSADLGEIVRNLTAAGRAVDTRREGILTGIESARQGDEEAFNRAQANVQTQQGLLTSLIQGQQAKQAAALFPGQLALQQAQIAKARSAGSGGGSGTDVFQQLREQPVEVPTFDDFINQKQEEAQQSFTQQKRESLKDEYNSMVDSLKSSDPSTLANTFEQKAIASRLAKFATESGREQLGRLLGTGDIQGAQQLVDSLGRPLTATQATKLSEIARAPQVLEDLRATLGTHIQKFGPARGTIAQLNKYDPSGQAIQSQTRLITQLVGKALEDGVLRKEDELKYKRILPQLSDLPSVALSKINVLNNTLKRDYNTRIDTFSNAGFNVSNFRQFGGVEETRGVAIQPSLLQNALGQGMEGQTNIPKVGDTIDIGGQAATILEFIQ